MNRLPGVPQWQDPRIAVAGLLTLYVLLGITVLGFNRSITQIALVVAAACVLDVFLHRLLKGAWLFPFSALITGLSLSILVNYAHGLWYLALPVFFAISSKYLITVNQRHIYNPSLFGIVISLLVAEQMISASPAYQWGGMPAMTIFIVTAALLMFVFRIQRSVLILSFLGLYVLTLLLRAWLTRHHVPAETIILGTLTTPAFYLFSFFMITDPATSPDSKRGQFLMALVIVVVDFFLHTRQALSTLFYAAFVWYSLYYLWLAFQQWRSAGKTFLSFSSLSGLAKRTVLVSIIGMFGLVIFRGGNSWSNTQSPGFFLTTMKIEHTGLSASQGDILDKVDSRVKHVAKWLLSVGDAVAVADFDQDGLQDIFLTYPLKSVGDRASLYRNMGNFKFERVPLPVLQPLVNSPQTHGLPAAAIWLDYDNDKDQDLFIAVGYGFPVLLQNQLQETGTPTFSDVSSDHELAEFSVSLAVNALDYDRDGYLDILLGNAMSPWLPGYESPTPFTIFDLPAAEFDGDRRMLNVMHRSWHDADNGGENLLLRNTGQGFEKMNMQMLGLSGSRWTLDIGTGDLNDDGWTDLYLANDFGPDDLYINQDGRGFRQLQGKLRGSLGRDTYKGMNVSMGDVDGNGSLDIYISNVHEPLQAEGSMLWMNDGHGDVSSFDDAAARRNALNPRRFGWGGAMGDLDRDGRLDILQANGMVDDAYDRKYETCEDYWYWNARIALTGPDIHGYVDSWADLQGRCIFPYEQNRVMLNRGQFFVDVAAQVGWDKKDNARGIALADLDNDGDLDVLMTHQFAPVSVFRNDSEDRNWFGLELNGDGVSCNRDALGTRVEISYRVDGETFSQIREVTASNGLSAQGDHRLLFGLGDYGGNVRTGINWCGISEEELQLQSGRYHRVEQNDG